MWASFFDIQIAKVFSFFLTEKKVLLDFGVQTQRLFYDHAGETCLSAVRKESEKKVPSQNKMCCSSFETKTFLKMLHHCFKFSFSDLRKGFS